MEEKMVLIPLKEYEEMKDRLSGPQPNFKKIIEVNFTAWYPKDARYDKIAYYSTAESEAITINSELETAVKRQEESIKRLENELKEANSRAGRAYRAGRTINNRILGSWWLIRVMLNRGEEFNEAIKELNEIGKIEERR